MNQSPAINELATALSKFQSEVETVKQTSENPYFKSKYASLADIVRTVRPVMGKYGLAITQILEPTTDQATVTTMLMHQSGQFISSVLSLTPKDSSPQGMGSAITYARRYSYSAILGIATDEDDDGNAASLPKPKTSVANYPPKAPSQNPPTAPTMPKTEALPQKVIEAPSLPIVNALVEPTPLMVEDQVLAVRNMIEMATKGDRTAQIKIMNEISKLAKNKELDPALVHELRELFNSKFLGK